MFFRYVGNLPPGITLQQLAEFMNVALKKMGVAKDSQNSVVTAWVSPDGHYAFVELRTIEEANAALTYLNGIQVGVYNLKIGRPKGYNGASSSSSVAVPMQSSTIIPASGPGLGSANPLLASIGAHFTASSSVTGVATGDSLSYVIMASNIPLVISESDIKDLFTPFGKVRFMNIYVVAPIHTFFSYRHFS